MELKTLYGGKGIELLSPAGNLSCALAAFDAGADAVYCGLKQFNARERTENFSLEEMSKLLNWTHRHGKKVYVTFNTLIKETELPLMGEYLAELERLRPDALIIQDSGVLYAVQHYFPSLPLHASTQMGLHNSAGLALAKRLGFQRVILERQSTLEEIAVMQQKNPGVDLEVFIHGALCACISGTCLFSSWLGGWSGNRGKCKQPCRRRYHGTDGNGFFLSAQDLCTIELIPQIAALGVRSLKIEGRLRRADYVSSAVGAYRMALDAPDENAFREILPKAREMLSHTYGRKWSLGYYTKHSREELIKYDAMGVSGLLAGKVAGIADNGFKVSVIRGLNRGDVIRIQPRSGEEGPALEVTKMSVGGKAVNHVRHGETCLIHYDRTVPGDGFVYKISSAPPDYEKRIAAMELQQSAIQDLTIAVSRSGISVQTGVFRWEKTLELAEAGKHPLLPEVIENEFSTLERIGRVTCKVEGRPFLPASVLKALKNEFKVCFQEQPPERKTEDLPAEHLKEFRTALRGNTPARNREKFSDSVILPNFIKSATFKEKNLNVIRELAEENSPGEELLLPFFVSETELEHVREKLQHFLRKGGKRIRISSLHHLELLKGIPDLRIGTNTPLPVCNSLAVRELADLGCAFVQAHIELEETELEAMIWKSILPVEVYCYGRPPLLSTRAGIAAGKKMSDARGENFRIESSGELTQIFAEKVMSIPRPDGAAAVLFDYRHARPGERDTADFNFSHQLS